MKFIIKEIFEQQRYAGQLLGFLASQLKNNIWKKIISTGSANVSFDVKDNEYNITKINCKIDFEKNKKSDISIEAFKEKRTFKRGLKRYIDPNVYYNLNVELYNDFKEFMIDAHKTLHPSGAKMDAKTRTAILNIALKQKFIRQLQIKFSKIEKGYFTPK